MKKISCNDELPNELADIASGKIFDVPPGYFENLSGTFFDGGGNLRSGYRKPSTIKRLRPWLVAASIALVALLGWWLIPDAGRSEGDFISISQLDEYIRMEIMEYDLELLSAQLNEKDLYSISSGSGGDLFEAYIEENLEDFEEIIY